MCLVTWILGVFLFEFSVCQMIGREFLWRPNPTVGPQRLSTGWTDHSLFACFASCMIRHEAKCQSLLYNHVTKLCTPGEWLSRYEPVPTADEGELYSTRQCDISQNFNYYSHNTAYGCLYFDSSELTYADASAKCQSMKGHLAVLKTWDRKELLQGLVSFQIWVGLDDIQEEGKFVWHDDGTEYDSSLDFFANGQPNNGPSEDCVYMDSRGNWPLHDADCSNKLKFYCEKDFC